MVKYRKEPKSSILPSFDGSYVTQTLLVFMVIHKLEFYSFQRLEADGLNLHGEPKVGHKVIYS